jgi:pyrroloquinoline quinone biosynthesis protein E
MGGWGRQFLNVSPTGNVLPCHAAESITGMRFDNVRETPLAEIWRSSPAFEQFRGTAWMPEPCRSCVFAAAHEALVATAARESAAPAPELIYRRIGGG